jgi:hypothetical protein
MKLAPVLPLKKKSRTRQRVEGLLRLFGGKKKSKKPTTEGAGSSVRPPSLRPSPSARPAPRSTIPASPSLIDAQAALMGDADGAVTLAPVAGKKRRKPKKNPFLSTPVPDTFRPPAPIGPLPSVHPPPLRADAFPEVERNRLPAPAPVPAFAKEVALAADTRDLVAPAVPKPLAPQPLLASSPRAEMPPPRRAPSAPVREMPPRTRAGVSHVPAPRVAVDAFVHRQALSTAPVRAVAVAHEKSNAVGTVELSCTAAGLLIQFVRISSYTEGYVPYPATSSERITVPYEQVARVDVDGDGLVHLTLDPSCTPYHRMVLAGLARDPAFDHVASHRRRARIERNVTLAALVVWVPVALVLRAVLPDLSAAIVMGMAASTGLVLHLTRRDIASKLVLFNRDTEQVRDELIGELRYRLAPGRVRSTLASEVPAPEAAPAELGEPQEADVGSLRGLFATAGVVAVVAAVAILIGKNLLFSSPPDPEAMWGEARSEQQEPRPAADPLTSAGPVIAADPTPVIPPPPPCSCDRADSPLWSDGVPRMSVLAHNRPGPTSVERPSMYPEIAVVNNSAEDLKDIVMVVDFLLGPRDGRKARVVDKQDLFWEGRLGPGRAVKWRVRGRGDDFAVTSFVSGMIGQEAKPAPADEFYKLSMTANTPSVRLHGTKMLAYLGDERVVEGLEKLRQEGREEMADTVEQIAAASRPLRVCSVQSNPDPADKGRLIVKACVYNASPVQVPRPWVTATAKLVESATDARWSLPEDLPSKTGLITMGTVPIPTAEDEVDPKSTIVQVVAER